MHEGRSIDHTPGSDVSAGGVVVQGELVGVARTAIAANALSSLAVVGVHDFSRVAADRRAIATRLNARFQELPEAGPTQERRL